MVDEHFKNMNIINDLNLDSSIYKYIPFKYLKIMIQNATLRFDRVDKWEDVYENWFLKERFMASSGQEAFADNLIVGVFGQSWTLNEESDAMWRIYSKLERSNLNYLDETAVRIRTTARKLYDVIYTEDKCMATTYIGRVKYLSQEDFKKMHDSLTPLPFTDFYKVLTYSYFEKRNPFEHENEVRAIVIYPSNSNDNFGKEKILFGKIDVDNLIEGFVCDPRLTPVECDSIRAQLVNMGISDDKIKQSELYKLEPHMINLKDE